MPHVKSSKGRGEGNTGSQLDWVGFPSPYAVLPPVGHSHLKNLPVILAQGPCQSLCHSNFSLCAAEVSMLSGIFEWVWYITKLRE